MDFEAYVRQSTRSLLRVAVVLTNDADLAQDVVQEVLVRAHVRWGRIGSLPHPHAYVRRMVVNEVTSWHRKWGRIEPRDVVDAGATTDPSGVVDTRDELLAGLDRLPPKQRAAVVLRYFEDLDDREIAEALACREATVRGYIHRGLKALRVALRDPGSELLPTPPTDERTPSC